MVRRTFLMGLLGLSSSFKAYMVIDYGNGTKKSQHLMVTGSDTPFTLLNRMSLNGKRFPVVVDSYGSMGKLVQQISVWRNDWYGSAALSKPDHGWMLFRAPSKELRLVGKKVSVTPLRQTVISRDFFLHQATDAIDHSRASLTRPYVPESLRSSTDPAIQRQIAQLDLPKYEQIFCLAYVDKNGFDNIG